MPNLNLNNVTLVSIDDVDPVLCSKIMNSLTSRIQFAEAKLFTSTKELPINRSLVHNVDRPIRSLEDYSDFLINHVHKHIDSPFVMFMQRDGYPVNPDAWTDEFFDYDYVGAPWTSVPPYARAVDCPTGKCVGNGGFSLRSRALMQEVSTYGYNPYDMKYVEDVNNKGNNEDVYVCREVRDTLEAKGFKFAPTELASFFSVENSIYTAQFGFHGPQTLILNKKFGLFKFRDHAYEKDYLD